jgi:hypothetical protein
MAAGLRDCLAEGRRLLVLKWTERLRTDMRYGLEDRGGDRDTSGILKICLADSDCQSWDLKFESARLFKWLSVLVFWSDEGN